MPPARVMKLAKAGQIPHLVLPDGSFVFPEDDLAAWIEKLRKSADLRNEHPSKKRETAPAL
jgi:hypothetical protein